MQEISLIVICTLSAVIMYKFAYEENKNHNYSGTVLMTTLGSLSVVCAIISASKFFAR